jgi:hypothetical protein
MSIDITAGNPLRHVASFYSSGVWTAPINATKAFVSIHGATGGGGGPSISGVGGAGGTGVIASGWVQLTPGGTHVVTVGAGGGGGSYINANNGNSGGSGGTSTFDGAILGYGSAGGQGATSRYGAGGTGSAGSSFAFTSLSTVSPGPNTLARVNGSSSQNSGGVSGGAGSNSGSGNFGASGSAGFVHVYI